MLGGSCSAVVYWISDDRGYRRIIDCDCEGGQRPSETKDTGQLDLISGTTAEIHDGRGCDHHAQCPDVELFRRRER
jgi:hypothetical protein